MANSERKTWLKRYIERTNAAQEAYAQKRAEQEAEALTQERARYEDDPVGALRQDRKGWIIGESVSGAVAAEGIGGTIFLASNHASGTAGFIFLSAVGLAGVVYTEIGRWRTNKKIRALQNKG